VAEGQPARPGRLSRLAQEKFLIQPQDDLHFRIDVVLRAANGQPVIVLDTKYKVGPPSADDIAQIVAYAAAKDCHEAVLVYPSTEVSQIEERVGDIRVRTLPFSLEGDLDQGGQLFVDALMG